MRRRGLVGPLALAVIAALAPSAGAGHPVKSSCQRLKADDDLAPDKRVKLVERRNREHGKTLVGCVLPRGALVEVARSYDGYSHNGFYRLLQVAGRHVLVRHGEFTLDRAYEEVHVFDLEDGRSYRVASFCDEEPCNNDIPKHEIAARAFINDGGQAAAAIRRAHSDRVTIKGFSRHGKPTLLDRGTRDEIPPRSLRLNGHVVRWTHSGEPKRATLSG
jgi:hypothetical protein